MLSIIQLVVVTFVSFFSIISAYADEPLEVTVDGIPGEMIPEKFAYCVATETEKSTSGTDNLSPGVHWTAGPKGTKSYALIMMDPDVPLDFSNAGKEGKTIAINARRQPFYHWAVVNIPAANLAMVEGAGKPQAGSSSPAVFAVNDYLVFSGAAKSKENIEKHTGYDGPCPPWNDERVHHYHFKVYALDTETIAAPEPFMASQVLKLIKPHILAQGEKVLTYTLNPKLKIP